MSSSFNKFKNCQATMWDFLALSDGDLERADIVAMNISVAKGIKEFKNLDVKHYVRTVDEWTSEFVRRLPAAEAHYWEGGDKENMDIRFYRISVLQMFIGGTLGIRYNEEEKHAKMVRYTDPRSLFLNGLIDTKVGTCATMATLHVAMSRRMGWPVSLALLNDHQMSRFDDGEVAYNLETSHTDTDVIHYGTDKQYIERYKLSPKAVENGADLKKLTAREMMGVFVANRGRHYQDTLEFELQDRECCLARHLLPRHRRLYTMAMNPYLERGRELFMPDEIGHPKQLYVSLREDFGNGIDYPVLMNVGPPKPVATPVPIPPESRIGVQTRPRGIPVSFGKSARTSPWQYTSQNKNMQFVIKPSSPRATVKGQGAKTVTIPVMKAL